MMIVMVCMWVWGGCGTRWLHTIFSCLKIDPQTRSIDFPLLPFLKKMEPKLIRVLIICIFLHLSYQNRNASIFASRMDQKSKVLWQIGDSMELGRSFIWHGLRRHPIRKGWTNSCSSSQIPENIVTRMSRPHPQVPLNSPFRPARVGRHFESSLDVVSIGSHVHDLKRNPSLHEANNGPRVNEWPVLKLKSREYMTGNVYMAEKTYE